MIGIAQITFILLTLVTFNWAVKQYQHIYRAIHLGKEENISGDEGQRWKNVILVAFGQKKMFKRPIAAILHFFIYAAFLLTQIELLEILIDGFFGTHRALLPVLGSFYRYLIGFIEVLSVFALIATIAFLIRRNVLANQSVSYCRDGKLAKLGCQHYIIPGDFAHRGCVEYEWCGCRIARPGSSEIS